MKAILVSSEEIGVSQIDRKINVCLWVVCVLLLLLKGVCCKVLVSISVDFSKTWLQLPFSPVWPNRSTLAWHSDGRAFASQFLQQVVICDPHLHLEIRGVQGILPCVGWVVTASQLGLPSLTPLSVAGCDRLQLGAPHWATSVDYCK